MSSYPRFHAELYDLFYQDKPYQEETSFLHNVIQNHSPGSKKILELACGTGNHAFIFEKLGYQMTSVDYSHDMIHRALEKKAPNDSKILFLLGNMKDLSALKEKFDTTVCLFDSIGYLQDNESIQKTFQEVYNHLEPNGLFIVEYWNAFAMVGHFEPVRKKVFHLPEKTIIRLSETTINYEEQIATVQYTIFEHLKNGTFSEFHEVQKNRFFSPQEIQLFALINGFTVLMQYSGYSKVDPITDKSWHIIVVLQKREKVMFPDL